MTDQTGVSPSQPKIRGLYEWICTAFLAGVGLWLLVTVVAIVLPIIVFLRSGKVLEW